MWRGGAPGAVSPAPSVVLEASSPLTGDQAEGEFLRVGESGRAARALGRRDAGCPPGPLARARRRLRGLRAHSLGDRPASQGTALRP